MIDAAKVPLGTPDRHARPGSFLPGALAVVVLALLAHHALLSPEGFRTRDHIDFYLRVGQYAQEFRDHHWPQSLPDALRGGGHAFPLYYPPLAHWLALGAHFTGLSLIPASHLTALLSVALSGLFLFLLLRHLTGSSGAALFGAVCYLVFPYRYQLLQNRGTFAEGWLLAWLPAIVLATRLQAPARALWLPFAIALLFLSHVALSLWALPMIALLVWRAEPTREQAFTSLKALTRGTVIAIGLSMFYLLPVHLGLHDLNASDPVVMRTTPKDVASGELLFSGLRSPDVAAGAVSLLVLAAAIRLLRRPRDGRLAWRWGLASIFPILLAVSALAAPSLPWHLTPDLVRYIQSPVRLLGPIGFFLALIAGLWSGVALRSRPVQLGLLTTTLLAAALAWGPDTSIERISARQLAGLEGTGYSDLGFTLVGDYLPRGSDPASLARRIEAARLQAGHPPLTRWERIRGGFDARVEAPGGTVVRLPLVGYGFHDVRRQDGATIDVLVTEGQLAVVGNGEAVNLVVRRRFSPGMVPGFVISLAALGFLLGSAYRARAGAAGPRFP